MGKGTAQLFKTQFPGYSSLEAIQRLIETDEFDGEIRYPRKDKSTFIGHARSIVLRGPGETFIGMVTTIRDITERKQAEEALHESQARLEAVFSAIPYVILEFDTNLNPIMANPAAKEAFGAPVEGLSAGKAIEKLNFRTLNGSAGQIEDMPTFRALRGETVSNALYKVTTADGNEHVISIYATPLYKDGKVNSVVALWHDLTERIRAEDALRESEERYRAVVEHALDAILVTDPSGEGRVLSVNPAACHMFGYSMEEFLQLKREDLLDINDPSYADYMQKRRDAKEIATELIYKRKNGSRFLGDLSNVFYQDKNGELRAVAIIRDITERKRNEEAVQRSEALLRVVIDQMPSGVTVRDAYSGETVLSNPRSHEILGSLVRTPGDFMEYRGFHSNGLPYRNEEWPLFRSINTGEMVWAEEISCVRDDGSRFALSINSAPIRDSNGKIVMGVAVFDDITERKQNEEHLSATLKEKVVLLQEIHHRVKNNLQVISSLLRLQATTMDDPKVREILAESQRRVRAMALIHEQLYKSPSLAQINFKNYINELVHYLRRSFTTQAASSVEISVAVEETDIEMDQAVPLGLLVSELVSNSLKHAFSSEQSNDAKKVWITARREPSDGLIVSIGDNGAGIPETLDIERSPTMGLQLVMSFVTQLQGQLTIQRKPGTVITVTIPERKD
jgi:PAS domain S-box-containing protein